MTVRPEVSPRNQHDLPMSPGDLVTLEIRAEYERSLPKHHGFNSTHEAYAVILEELDELWDEVKRKEPDLPAMRKEAIQIAAMALKLILFIDEKGQADD